MTLCAWAIMLVASAGAQTSSAAYQVTMPRVTGPLPVTATSRPFLGAPHTIPVRELVKEGYVEEEFLISGQSRVYDWLPDNSLVVKSPGGPYTTRILVRRPADPARFTGAVVVELMYPPRRWDWPMMWGYIQHSVIARGDAWVGVTMPGTVAGLQRFDANRYGPLSFANPSTTPCPGAVSPAAIEDGLRWDMISQVAAALKAGTPGTPFAAKRAEALYLTTQGGDLTTYVNAIHPHTTLGGGRPVFDGYLSRPPFAAARINACASAPPAADRRQALLPSSVPVMLLSAQGDLATTYPIRREDSDASSDRYRLYEIAGAPHIDVSPYTGFPSMADQAAAGNAIGTAEWPFAAPCEPPLTLLRAPIMAIAYDAAFANLDRWARQGIAPPRASRLATRPGSAAVAPDEHGNGVGGVRSPYVDVPIATYVTNGSGPGNCPEMGYAKPFDAAKLRALYGTRANYATRLKTSVDALVAGHWLTPADAQRVTDDLLTSYDAASR